jgi:hypothetical protein
MSAAAGARQRNRHGAHRGKSRDRTFSSAGLDDEDILASHALFNLNARLAALELVEQHLGRRYAEVVADGPARGQLTGFFHSCGRDLLGELRVRAAAQDDDVADHDDGGWWGESSFQSLERSRRGVGGGAQDAGGLLGPSRRGRWEQCILQELESMVNV